MCVCMGEGGGEGVQGQLGWVSAKERVSRFLISLGRLASVHDPSKLYAFEQYPVV